MARAQSFPRSNNAARKPALLHQATAHFTLAHDSVSATLLSKSVAIHHAAINGYGFRVSTLTIAYCAAPLPAGNVQLRHLAARHASNASAEATEQSPIVDVAPLIQWQTCSYITRLTI